MKPALLSLLALSLLLSPSGPASAGDPRAACRDECVSCSVRCSSSSSKAECLRTCREVKRSCCLSSGHHAGPPSSCGCGT